MALRRLRRFAREGAADELDIPGTIEGTAKQGWLDIRMRPERKNKVKVLLNHKVKLLKEITLKTLNSRK